MTLPPRVSDLTAFDLLLSVARLGSLGRAAAEHGISQPAASARMRQLEGHLGLALIERSPRGSHLTPDGALVADWAQAAAVALTAENSADVAAAVLAGTADVGFVEGPDRSAGRRARAPVVSSRMPSARRPA